MFGVWREPFSQRIRSNSGCSGARPRSAGSPPNFGRSGGVGLSAGGYRGWLSQPVRMGRPVGWTFRWTVPDLREALEAGVSFDRVQALSKIRDKIGLLEYLDVAGVERQAASHTPITVQDEQRSSDDRFLILQPSLDQSWWKLWGGLDGLTGGIIDQAIGRAADQLPADPETPRESGMETSHRSGPDLYQRHTPIRPGRCPRRHQTCSRKQRNSRSGLGSRTQGRAASPRSGPLRIGSRSHRPGRRRNPHGLRTEDQDHPPSPTTGHPPPRPPHVQRGRP